MANLLTALRLLLVLPFAFSMAHSSVRSAALSLAALIIAITTDIIDGPIARRSGTVSAASGTFDHTSDFLFVTCGLFGGAVRHAIPWILPILITAAFTQYVVDSYWIQRRRALRGSQLGRYNGILYFVPLCADALIRLGLRFFQPLLAVMVWLLVASTITSMGQRLLFSLFGEKLPAGALKK